MDFTVFNALPGAAALVKPDSPIFTIVASTAEFAAFGNASKNDLIGESLFKYFPDNPDVPNFSGAIRASLAICISSKKKNELASQRYDIVNADGTFSEMYWAFTHTPVLDESGNITYIIHTAVSINDGMLADTNDEKLRLLEPAHNLFMQSSVAIHIFKGPELIIDLANEPTLRIWGKDKSVIGKPLQEVSPELFNHYFDIIHNVRNTKKSFREYDAPVTLNRNGQQEVLYLNHVIQPYYEFDKSIPTGVLVMVSDVTDIHNDRKALVEKERSLELAIAIGGLGVFSIDFRNGEVGLSPQIMEWLGITKTSVPLVELIKFIHADDLLLVNDTLGLLFKEDTGRRHDITFRALNPKTKEWQYLRSIGQVQMEDGLPITLLGIIQDITASVQSRLTYEQNAQRFQSFIESAPFPIGIYIGREMRIEMCNQTILNIWGKDHSVIGKCYAEVLPELAGQGIFEQLDEVYMTGKPFHALHQRVDLQRDGKLEPFYFNYSFTPLFGAEGKVYGVMNTAAEVTDLIVAQKNLKESERNFRMMILQAPVAMCILNGPSHIIDIANESMIALWGKEESDVMNKPVFEALPDVKEQGLEAVMANVYDTGETFTANEHPIMLVRFGKPETIYVNFVYEPYCDPNGNILGILVIAIDVTTQVIARHQIEEVVNERTREFELANANLQKSNAELEQFAYIASHDLQEPLRKINMFTGMLQNSLDTTNATAHGHMKNISNSVTRMTNLIRDILSYSQLSRAHEPFEKTKLEDIFNETIADFDLISEEKQATVAHSGLPVIDAIPLQMVQLFHNLISNALKYSSPGVAPAITITGEKMQSIETAKLELPIIAAPYYKIIFKDNGIGFSQEYASKIFNIFQRLHGRGQYEGTGIGLAICKKIVENHNGLVYASSKEGEGAEFVVVLPGEQV